MPNKMIIHFIDEDGDKAAHPHWINEAVTFPGSASLEAHIDALADVSNAGIPSYTFIRDIVTTDPPGTGPYDIEDKMAMRFLDVFQNTSSIAIPAPVRAVMEPNDDEFSIQEVTVDDFITEALLYLVSKGAEALTDYIKSKRGYKGRKS